METTLFPMIFGCAFILLGRWAYRNPRKIYGSSIYRNPDSPFLKRFVRVSAILFIFVGSFAMLTTSGELLIHNATLVVAFTVPAAVVAAWLLRPRVLEAVATTNDPSMPVPGLKLGFLTTKGKWILWISIALAIACVLVISAIISLNK